MSTIQDLFQQAQLAEATYADFSDPRKSTFDALTTGDSKFSAAQTTAFVKEWKVADHIPNTPNGFSATLFERLDASGTGTGQFSLAIRGSTFDALGLDFQADVADIFIDGVVLDQLVDMYNYWQRLTAAANTGYQIAKLTTLTTETIALQAAYALGLPAGLAYEISLRTRPDVVIDNPTHTVRTIQFTPSAQADGLGLSAATVDVSGKQVWVGNPYDIKSNPQLREVKFGSDIAETSASALRGGAASDHLYGGGGNSGRVQFLAQYLTQRTDRHWRIAFRKGCAQGLVNQRLVAFPLLFCAFPKGVQNSLVQINRDACLPGRGNHGATFGISHIVFSFHSISFHAKWPTVPKSDGWPVHDPSSTPSEFDPAHPRPRSRSALLQWHRYLSVSAPDRHKTRALLPRTKHRAYADWWLLSSGRMQKSCINDTYNICINQVGNTQAMNHGENGNDVLNGDNIQDSDGSGLAGSLHGTDYLDGGEGNKRYAQRAMKRLRSATHRHGSRAR